ncbi:MAG TPA: N-6 DNA methylase [Candidatus Tectomicrobia bacterium]
MLTSSDQTLGEILMDHADSYRLFRYLNDRFNGDLFPGKGSHPEEWEQEWRTEMEMVCAEHLRLLSEFVEGKMQMRSGQYSLWPTYSFDVMPLEFISSIYETFVESGVGKVHTPVHLVDFILDAVLPWRGEEWDLKILDPACGSGIFLVKSLQRLMHRWKRVHPEQRMSSDDLRSLLENNLFG